MQSPKKLFFVWLFSLAIIIGPAYNLYIDFDSSANPDCQTYMSIANGEFKDQSLTRRYRILIPFAAKTIALPIEIIYAKLWPHRADSEWPLKMGFLVINLLAMATIGCCIYLCGKAYAISEAGCILAILAVLCGGRWGNLMAAVPATDSLYLLIITLVVLGIKTNNVPVLIFCILVGPLAKESFIFVAPVIFFFSSVPKWKQVIVFAAGGFIAFAVRYKIDQLAGSSTSASIINDTGHIENIVYSLQKIFGPRGLGELATVMGLFSIIIVAGFMKGKEAIKSWTRHVDPFLWWFIPVMIVHALLSGEVARMLYLGSAVWAVMLGLIWDNHPIFIKIKSYAFDTIKDRKM